MGGQSCPLARDTTRPRPFPGEARHRWRADGIGLIIEEADWHIEYPRHLQEPACSDAIGATLVLLYLLKGDAESISELRLAQP